MNNNLRQIESQLRAALDADKVNQAQQILSEYRAEFDKVWSALPESARRVSSLPGEACELIQWAASMAAIIRSATRAQRRVVKALGPYNRNGYQAGRTWQASI